MSINEARLQDAVRAARQELERQHEERHDGPYTGSEDRDDSLLVDGVVDLVSVVRIVLESAEQAIEALEREAVAEAERRIGLEYLGTGIDEVMQIQREIDRFVEGARWAHGSTS